MKQKDALVRKIDLEESRDTDLHPLARKIIALLPDHETLTLGQLVQLTGGKPTPSNSASRNSSKKATSSSKVKAAGRIM